MAAAAYGRPDTEAAEAFALEGAESTGPVEDLSATSWAPHLTGGQGSPFLPHPLALLRAPALWLTLGARSWVSEIVFPSRKMKYSPKKKKNDQSELRLNYFENSYDKFYPPDLEPYIHICYECSGVPQNCLEINWAHCCGSPFTLVCLGHCFPQSFNPKILKLGKP